MSKTKQQRFRRTPEEIEAGLTVDQAKAKRKETDKWEDIAENGNGFDKTTQEDLTEKHESNPTIKTKVGAGDIVEKITKATGIKKLVDWFTPEGEDCGCDERKEKWNTKTSILRHKIRVECLTLTEYNYMKPLLSNNAPISAKDVTKLAVIYERVFNAKIDSSCTGCSFAKKLDELKAVLKTYDDE
jgi:hypothetical protein